jgi:tight adherence protein C
LSVQAIVLGVSAGTLAASLCGLLAMPAGLRSRRASKRPARAGRARVGPAGPRVARGPIGRRLALLHDLGSRILAAGEPGGMGTREWLAIKVGAGAAGTLLALPVATSSPGRLGLAVALAAPFAGFVAPDFWLARVAHVRSEAATRELPDMLDLLRVAIEGGQAPASAMAAVAERFDGPLAGEWHHLAASVALGSPLDRALETMCGRLQAPAVTALSEALRSAHRHGTAPADALATLARTTRQARAQQVRERAARAGPKIQLVVALILVPSVLLVVAAAIVSELTGSGLGG